MKLRKVLVGSIALAPLLPLSCSSGDNTTDGGADSGKDSTFLDVKADKADTAVDAPKDVTLDTKGDASDASDASADAPDASDASDATADASTDASDASADADAGGSVWHSPTCSGTISASAYGGASYETTSGSQIWYMTWDATNLYVGLAIANVGEGNVIYIGYSGSGAGSGYTYDNTNGTLPFKADAVVYAKHGYNEVRLASIDAGTWGAANANNVSFQFCDDGVNNREEVIPWSLLGSSGIPASFRFLAYATSSGGSVYGQIPTSNPSGSIGTSAVFGHDFYVSSTNNGAGAFPFATVE